MHVGDESYQERPSWTRLAYSLLHIILSHHLLHIHHIQRLWATTMHNATLWHLSRSYEISTNTHLSNPCHSQALLMAEGIHCGSWQWHHQHPWAMQHSVQRHYRNPNNRTCMLQRAVCRIGSGAQWQGQEEHVSCVRSSSRGDNQRRYHSITWINHGTHLTNDPNNGTDKGDRPRNEKEHKEPNDGYCVASWEENSSLWAENERSKKRLVQMKYFCWNALAMRDLSKRLDRSKKHSVANSNSRNSHPTHQENAPKNGFPAMMNQL